MVVGWLEINDLLVLLVVLLLLLGFWGRWWVGGESFNYYKMYSWRDITSRIKIKLIITKMPKLLISLWLEF